MAKKSKILKLLTCTVLLVMVISIALATYLSATSGTDYGSSPSITKLNNSFNAGIEKYFDSSVIYQLPDTVDENEEISLIIEMPTNTLLDAYDAAKTDASFGEYAETAEADTVRDGIRDEANALERKLSAAGIDYEVGEKYYTVLSGFEITITAKDFEDVCKTLSAYANVIVGEVYNVAETQLVSNSVNVYGTGIFNSAGFGYDGTGMVVAVLDTGLDYYHSAFIDDNFALAGQSDKLALTLDDIKSILKNSSTEAEAMQPGLNAEDVYVSDKVPFAFDYADKNADVFPLQSNHGTHVAGVIAGNKLDNIVAEDYTGEFVGVAPNAQLAIMKIFSDVEATARSSWILAALEDCVHLGVDVINMSIGTGCGFSRESDKEALNGVYDRIRERGISMVVAASNSFNSTYGSEKNGNLGLTSNPDSATVGSPSTYEGTLSVASIEGAKTPYLTYGDRIVYFIESTDRFSEEKDFVEELLPDGVSELEIEYVTIPGAGLTADYSGIDVTGKIALVKRGLNTFEEKANAAEKMGAAGIIIYNNVSGDIKMNVGDTGIAVASISQDDGEVLAASKSGTIKISLSQTSGPFMSDFSSWGPTPSLEIKPEITAHGGSILSAVPGESYDRISGTSMASPNVAGVTALLRQYVKENFSTFTGRSYTDGSNADAKDAAAIVNRLLMSTADIVINKNGLPYSVRKQGAGLANLTNSAATDAYIITYDKDDGSVMDKSKIEIGDDPTKTGVYNLTFAIKNFGSSTLSYALSAYVLTEGVSDTKTSHGETTVTETAYSLDGADVSFTVDGGTKNGNSVIVGAGALAKITVTIKLTDENKKYLDDSFENGMYVEGFVVLDAPDESTVDLSVPYLGFYGDWTEAPIFDLDWYETHKDEIDEGIDLLDKTLPDAYATRPIGGTYADYVSYLGSFYFEQNPANRLIAADRKYISLSNQSDTVNSLRYVWAGLLRNANNIEITITEDSTGEVIFEKIEKDVRKSYGDGGSIYPSNVKIEFSAIEHNLKNNTSYTVTLKSYVDYGEEGEDGLKHGGADTNDNNVFTFPFVTDFEAPALTDCEFYTEYDRSTKKTRLYAKLALYDNHYAMSLLPGVVVPTSTGEVEFQAFDRYMTPVYSDFNTTNYVVYELTDYVDEIMQSANKNTFTILTYDYALNNATYEIALPDEYEDFYFEEDLVTLSPNEVYTISPTVYPASEWAEFITYSSNNSDIVKVVGNKLVAVKSGGATITAKSPGGKSITFKVKVLAEGEEGYKRISKPVTDSFNVTGYYVYKAFYQLATEDRDIGATGDNMKFANSLHLSMYPSESVGLQYQLVEYFPDDTEVVFESANEKVVKVDRTTGVVTAVAEGNSSITIKVLMDGKSTYYSKSISVEVKEPWITTGPSLTHYFGAGADGVVTFPKNLAITEIGQFAFSNFDYVEKTEDDEISEESPDATKIWYVGDTSITEVVIPEGIERIGPYAFANLTALKKITLPSTLETIDYGAFYNCTALKEIVGLENVKFINQGAFVNCALDGTLNLDSAVAVANSAFQNNAYLDAVVLGDSTQSIGSYAFEGCKTLKTLTVKADKLKLGEYVFSGTALSEVNINAAVIPEGAFNDCTSLSSVTIGKDVAVIGEYAFRNTKVTSFTVAAGNATYAEGASSCIISKDQTTILLVAPALASLDGISIPASVTTIGDAAFSGNQVITSVNLPNVSAVGDYAFAECTALASVTLAPLTSIGEYAFENTAITSVPTMDNGVQIGDYAFYGSKITSVVIPNGMTVPTGAFMDCLDLSSVEIGDGADIGKDAFAITPVYYTVKTRYDVQKGYNPDSTADDGDAEYDYVNVTVYYYDYQSALTSLKIGADVTIGEGAFYGASKLEGVELGSSTDIGSYAFYNATMLKSIDLSSATSIGDYAFSGNIHYEYLTESMSLDDLFITQDGMYSYRFYAPTFASVDISSATYVGEGAFANCRSLTSVTLGDSLAEISDMAFQACVNLNTITNLEKVTAIGNYAFAECAFNTLDLSGAKTIGEYAFCYNEELTTVTLADGADIGEGAFSNDTALTNLAGEEKAVSIGDYAFAYTALNEADLTSAKYIGTQAFLKQTDDEAGRAIDRSLKLTLGKELEDIGDNPFALCDVDIELTAEVVESFNGKDYVTITDTFDIGKSIKVIEGSIYKVVPYGLELISWLGDTKAKIADNTVRISAMAFAGTDVITVSLPSTVKAIGHKAFYACDSLGAIAFSSYSAPILEEEYDENLYLAAKNIPATGDFTYADHTNKPIENKGLEIVPYMMWNVTSLPTNVYYGASFVDYVGLVNDSEKLTMIRPVNGQKYDSFIFSQYFGLTVDGGAAADSTTLAAIVAIAALPDAKDITLDHKDLVAAARAAYDKVLSNVQKGLITDYARLTQAEKKISDLEYLANQQTTPAPEVPPTEEEPKDMTTLLVVLVIIESVLLAAAITLLVIFVLLPYLKARKTKNDTNPDDSVNGQEEYLISKEEAEMLAEKEAAEIAENTAVDDADEIPAPAEEVTEATVEAADETEAKAEETAEATVEAADETEARAEETTEATDESSNEDTTNDFSEEKSDEN